MTVADAAGAALLAGLAGVLAWRSLAYWPAERVDETQDGDVAPRQVRPHASL